MTNIIKAIMNIVENPVSDLGRYSPHSRSSANSMGDRMEEYIKDVFANTIGETDMGKRTTRMAACFSYLGNQNNPPDIILRNGDAIEVKKKENYSSPLVLNSSHPKAKLFSDSNMITDACRKCESWREKDIIYAVGVCNGPNKLAHLSFVYGVDYAASAAIYERIKNTMREGILSIPDVGFDETTKELGRVNRVDPLGITFLRIRGIWQMENPTRVFREIYQRDAGKDFSLMAVINTEKYNSFHEKEELERLANKDQRLKIGDVHIKVPDNPARLKEAKLVTFSL